MQARCRVYVVGLLLLVCSDLAAASSVAAQDKQIEASFQGAVGLGLVGAELGAVIPALAGVESAWAYIVCPVIGAAGGAVAGYFTLDRPNHVELSIGALALGMALVIPAFVVTLSATAYDAGDVSSVRGQSARVAAARTQSAQQEPQERRDRHDIPPLPKRSKVAHRRSGSGMLRLGLDDGSLAFAAPAVALVPGTRANGEWRVAGMSISLMSGQF